MNRKFQRKIEDFVCENCGQFVVGNGYTNHCPKCLWSKHVDNNPGDRQNDCGGLMEPTEAFLKKGEWVLIHRCQKCREKRSIFINKENNKKILESIFLEKN